MSRALLTLLAAGLTVVFAAGAVAGTPCQDCQNECLAPLVECQKKHAQAHCHAKHGEAYGTCKVGCKGKPVCLDNCRHIDGRAKKGQRWHGALCYSGEGCTCSAIRCAKPPHVRDARCVSPPG